MKSTNYFAGVAVLVMISVGALSFHSTPPGTAKSSGHTNAASAPRPEAAKPEVMNAYGKLPLRFEANQGQTDSQVKFLSHGNGYALYLTPTEAVLSLQEPAPSGGSDPETLRGMRKIILPEKIMHEGRPLPNGKSTVLRMQLVGANPAPEVLGREELPGKSNYFIGNDPKKWRTNVANYARVEYKEIYPGVDLVYYGNQRQLEHDFIVAPGADPGSIALGFEGAEKLSVDAQGDLVLAIQGDEILLTKPVVYQGLDGMRKEISGKFKLKGRNQVVFEVARYDLKKPLVIDPILTYSTYLGGSASDIGYSIAVDSSGNAYVTGYTSSNNFPTTAGVLQNTYGGAAHAFVAKINADGSGLVYSTYLGGGGTDYGYGIAVDSSGNAYVTGYTLSSNFPTTEGAFQSSFGGGYSDAFVTKLNAGGALTYSTYLGGNSIEDGRSIALDSAGSAYVTGDTYSFNFPTTADAFQRIGDNFGDVFVAKINADEGGLVYSTYLGGSISFDRGYSIAVDSSGNTYLTGMTYPFLSNNIPTTADALQRTRGGYEDAFVAKISFNQPPVAVITGAPAVPVECASHNGTQVMLDGSGSHDPNGDTLTYAWSEDGNPVGGNTPTLAVTVPLGLHSLALTVTDPGGLNNTATTKVTVQDTTPPSLSVVLSPNSLWPPNGFLVPITATISASDVCDATPKVVLMSITANEPLAPGDVQDVTFGTDDRSFGLAVTRLGSGNGRVYTVTYRATDASGNSTTANAPVTVPHDQQ